MKKGGNMGLSNAKILSIDDDEVFLNGTKIMFEQRGLEMDGVTSGKEAIQILKEQYFDYDIVLIDLAIPEMDGIEIFKAIKKINPQLPILFASAHLGEQPWERKLRDLGLKVKTIEKPFPIITSPHFMTIEEMIRNFKENYRAAMSIPFKFSLEEFMELTDDERDKVFEDAYSINCIFVENYFDCNPDKDWLTIAQEPGNIVASGASKDEPFEEDLFELSQNLNALVFTYSRAKIIEQIDNSWSCKSNPDDYYPTVTLGFNSKGNQKNLQGDFDTGSTHSFLSYEEILAMEVLDRKLLMQAGSKVLWNKPYTYYRKKLKCKLYGNSKEKDIELKCELVKNWQDSPQVMHFGDRVALIGRNLLLDNKVKMVLDGENKETDII
jgi:CheY-like chemotaxis protein